MTNNNKKGNRRVGSGKLAIVINSVTIFAVVVTVLHTYAIKVREEAYDVKPISTKQISSIVNDTKAKKLMIVAHPDDEFLWGGAHMASKDYLVVCVTDGRNKVRKKEFESIMKESGNSYLMLEYPDKVLLRRDSWHEVYKNIESDIEKIMTCKNWDLVVTHNRHGEYGHEHHKMTHSIVTDIYDKDGLTEPLYNFGRYYRAVDIGNYKDKLVSVSNEQYEYKKTFCYKYISQKTVVDNLWHMAPYEMWTQYKPYSENSKYGNLRGNT